VSVTCCDAVWLRWLQCQVLYGSPDEKERPTQPKAVLGFVEPARRPARVRQRDQHSFAFDSTLSYDITQRSASPQTLDGERSDQEHHARSHERELRIEPRRAERDLGRRGSTIPYSGRRFAREALRDRRAVRKMSFIDAGLREPASKLGARASGERQTRRELDRAGSLADDHHAIGRVARHDRKRRRQVACLNALRARADARVQSFECALRCADHGATARGSSH
jgi:hypothetical protein